MLHIYVLFCLSSLARGLDSEVWETFVGDVVNKWSIMAPTIIFQDEIPHMCMELEWSLCLTDDMGIWELATHLDKIIKLRRQDGVIFAGGQGHKILLEQLAKTVPSIFSSNYPVFMPNDYSNDIDLRLDSNVIFYNEETTGNYELIDKFTIKGGPTMVETLAYWSIEEGIILQTSMNRWDRRSDLKGTSFDNGLLETGDWANFKRDDDGGIIGSQGYFQDMLFYITDTLNLTVETVEVESTKPRLLNGSWTGPLGLLQKGDIDVLSIALGINLERSDTLDLPLATYRQPVTLVAVKRKGAAPNMWVYVQVFGLIQWMLVTLLLVLLGLILSFISVLRIWETDTEFGSKRGAKKEYSINSIFSSFALIYLYAIQMGSHTNSRKLTPRLITLTASITTFLIFVAFSTDITAEMTSSPSDIPVRTFEDVIKHDYKVVAFPDFYAQLLEVARPGTAKNIVYNSYFKKLPTIKNDGKAKAIFEVLSEPKTLWYTVFSSTHSLNPNDQQYTNQLFALKMDDAVYGSLTLGLQKDSEFHQVFNHYILKQFETGYARRLFRTYHTHLFTKTDYEMNEPQPLGFNNVMFCFIVLALGICFAVIISIREIISVKLKRQKM